MRSGAASGAGAPQARQVAGATAAHAVAAGVYEAAGGTDPRQVMPRMIAVLAAMHARNPEWRSGAA